MDAVQPTVQRERRLAWEGCLNARDTGGYATRDGKVTRWGEVIRSASPSLLTPSGQEGLEAHGILTATDLRFLDELGAAPNPLSDPVHPTTDGHISLMDPDAEGAPSGTIAPDPTVLSAAVLTRVSVNRGTGRSGASFEFRLIETSPWPRHSVARPRPTVRARFGDARCCDRGRPTLAEESSHQAQQRRGVDRLAHEAHARHVDVGVDVAGEDNGARGAAAPEAARQRQAAHARDQYVADEHVGRVLADVAQGVQPVERVTGDVPCGHKR
jgi:hypothetical protein